MQVFANQGQQDLKCSRWEWIKFSFGHICSIIDISISDYIKGRSCLSISLCGAPVAHFSLQSSVGKLANSRLCPCRPPASNRRKTQEPLESSTIVEPVV